MPRKREPARCLGPYQEGERWRIVTVENRRRTNHFAETWEDAVRLLGRLRRQLVRRQLVLSELLEEYRHHRLRVGMALPATIEQNEDRIRGLLGGWVDSPVADLTPARAAAAYQAHADTPSRRGRPYSAATHQFDLRITRIFFRWAVKAGRVEADPFAQVQPLGRPNVGKPQLRIDEARRFSDAAFEAWREGDPLALAALMALWMGLRASEALYRQVRDLDDGGRVLWIPGGKTTNARRRLEVPEVLRGPLLQQARDRPGDAWLFPGPTGQGYRRTALNRAVTALCQRAGVPNVCTHSLRGLHTTLALGAGATAGAVASALGHGSFAMTAKHYAAPGSVESAASSRVAGILGTGSSDELLRGLDEGTLRDLLALLEERKRGR